MIQLWSIPILAILGALVLSTAPRTHAQDSEAFQCGVIALATAIELDGQELNFDSITPSRDCQGTSRSILMPKKISYRIYTLPVGDIPRISMFPEGLVKPRVVGTTLELDIQDIMTLKSLGASVQAAVNIFVPIGQLKYVNVEGSDMNVAVTNIVEITDAGMTVTDYGADNDISLTSPYSAISYQGFGKNSRVRMEVASGSSIYLSGIDQVLYVKADGDTLDVDMAGANEKVYVDGGGANEISLSGVDSIVYLNAGSCDTVVNSGIDNSCIVTNETVSVPDFDCLVTSNLRFGCEGAADGEVDVDAEGIAKAVVWTIVFVAVIVLICCCVCIGCLGGLACCF
jgi:hypothetical protein